MNESRWRSVLLSAVPARLPADPDMLSVWSGSLALADDLVARCATLLAPDEQARAARLIRAEDRRRFIVAHSALRILLARYTGDDPRAIGYVVGPQGKPALAGDRALSFNLSHAGELAVVAIMAAPARLGVDIEAIREVADALALAESHFAPSEQAALAVVPPERRSIAFLTGWTRKEAVVKALGGGLSIPLDTFAVSLDDPPLLRIPGAASALRLVHLAPCEGYLGAVAIDRPLRGVDLRHLVIDALP